MLRIALTFFASVVALCAHAAPLVQPEGIAGLRWLSTKTVVEALPGAQAYDYCRYADAILQGKLGPESTEDLEQKIGRECQVVDFKSSLGQEVLTLTAHFDFNGRMVSAFGELPEYNSFQASALACMKQTNLLTASYGAGATRIYAGRSDGFTITTTDWTTNFTRATLDCSSNVIGNKGTTTVTFSYRPWSEAKRR